MKAVNIRNRYSIHHDFNERITTDLRDYMMENMAISTGISNTWAMIYFKIASYGKGRRK